ncbi:MAG: hypothetical protein ACPF9W_09090, partial [Nocardioides sp.]
METPAAPAADRPADGRSGRPADRPADRPAVLLATADPLLQAEVQRLAASVGVGIVPVPDDGGLLRRWQTAPLVLLGARAGFSQPATRAVRPSRELAQRAFRFVLAGSEVDVVARSVVERDLWLLAVQSLPIGAA